MIIKIFSSDKNSVNSNSIILGILLTVNLIVNCISLKFNVPNLFAIIITLLGILSVLISGLRINRSSYLLICSIALSFMSSYLFVASSATNRFILSFITIIIPTIIIASKTFDFHDTIKTIQLVSLLCFPYTMYVITTQFSIYDSGSLMGVAYAILPVVISSLVILFNSGYQSWRLIALFNLIFMLIASSQLIARGYFISIILAIGLSALFKYKDNIKLILRPATYLTLLLGLLLLVSWKSIQASQLFYNLFELKSNDFLNGRTYDLQNLTNFRPWNEIIFGSGIGSYYRDYKFEYVHNVLGMIYYELGIIAAVAMVIIIFKSFTAMMSKYSGEAKLILMFLFCTSIVRLMVSYNLWYDQIFWIFLTFSLMPISMYRKYSHRELGIK